MTGLDRYYYPIIIPEGATIRIKTTDVSLTQGTYYAHNSAGSLGGYPSFYQMLTARLIAVYGGGWTIEALRPPGYALRSGVRLSLIATPAAETIDLSLTTPIVRQLLGFDAADTRTVPFVSGHLDGERAAWGSWAPYSLFEGRATNKNSARSRDTQWSSDAPEVAVPIVWRERRVRVCTYQYVFGCHIVSTRALTPELAAQAGVGLGDGHNSLDELWAVIGRDLPQLLVTHDADELSLELGGLYDIALLATRAAASSMEQLARRNTLASDLWDVTVPLVITGGTYGL